MECIDVENTLNNYQKEGLIQKKLDVIQHKLANRDLTEEEGPTSATNVSRSKS